MLTPQQRAWVERERAWGTRASQVVIRQRDERPADKHGLEQFTTRMALVELTGRVASWASRLHEGLSETEHVAAAAAFAVTPPFGATNPTTSDYDGLEDYIEARVQLLRELLAADGE